jgi:hypothetical protein
MSKSRHTEAQIVAALKQVEAGRTAEDMAREYGVSKHTIYSFSCLIPAESLNKYASSSPPII